MGRIRTFVGTSVSRVVDDDRIPNSVKTGLQRSLLKNGEMIDHVLDEMINSVGVRAERMYEYARSGQYVHGLPSGQFVNGAVGTEEVAARLALIEGGAVSVDYVRYGPPNSLHIGWMGLIERGYNQETNQLGDLSVSLGTPVYLHDMVVVVPADELVATDIGSLAQWGTAACAGYTPVRIAVTPSTREMVNPTPALAGSEGVPEHLLVTYTWVSGGAIQYDTFSMPITGYDDNARYFHAKYEISGSTKYWMYRDGAGTHSELDALFDRPPASNGSFFPFAYFRHNRVSEIEDKSTDAYRTTKKLVKYLGMDYDLVGEAIDANPDIADVEQAVLMFAVPANSTNPLELRYLWNFFNNMYLSQDSANQFRSDEAHALAMLNSPTIVEGQALPALVSVVIQDTRFKMALEHAGIYKRRVAGSIGEVGSYGFGFTAGTVIATVGLEAGGYTTVDHPRNRHHYRRQVSPGFYDEITIFNLTTVFRIADGYEVIGGATEEILLIPLDHSIVGNYSIPEREVIYARSLHFVFNCRVVVKLEWYETGLFHFVLLVIMLAITVYSQGATADQFIALLLAGQYVAAAILFVSTVLEYLFWRAVFKFFVKELGVEFAFLLALVAAAMGMADMIDSGSLAGIPFASDLLAMSSGLLKGIGNQVKADMENLLAEKGYFEAYKEEQLKLLETAQELLEPNSKLSPFVIFGETPQEFYNRTVHSGNIGVIAIDAVSSYVGTQLALPKLSDSFRGFEYEHNGF